MKRYLLLVLLALSPPCFPSNVLNLNTSENFTSLQDAIDNASSGHVLMLLNNISGNVTVNKSLTITANGTRSINGLGALSAILIDADSVTISGLEVFNASGDIINQTSAHSNTLVINNVVHDTTGDDCVELKRCNNCLIENVTAYACDQDGTSIAQDSNDSAIRNNHIYDVGSENAAIYVYNSDNITVENNYIHDSDFSNGILTYHMYGTAVIRNNTIANNTLDNTKGASYEAFYENAITIYKPESDALTLIEGNTITGNDGNGIGFGRIFAADIGNISIINNTIRDNTRYGIIAQEIPDSLVERNTVSGSAVGIYIKGSNRTSVAGGSLYGNGIDLLINGSGITAGVSGALFDNPAGGPENYTNISLSDAVASAYSISWSAQPAPPPQGYSSFRGKFINITNLTPGVAIDSMEWHWRESELSGYDESLLRLYMYNGTWSLVNGTPDTASNTLGLSNLVPASVYAILQPGQPEMNLGKTAPAFLNISLTNQLDFTIDFSVQDSGMTGAPQSWQAADYIHSSSTAETSPQVTFAPDPRIYVVFQHWTNTTSPPASTYDGKYWEIYTIYSSDNAQTWSGESILTNNSVADVQPNLLVSLDGTLVMIFQEKVGGTYELFISNSTDGVNWAAPWQITNNSYHEGDPTIEQDPGGMYYITFEGVIPPDGDSEIYIMNSSNLLDWSAPVAVTANSYSDWDPDVLIENGTFYLAWSPASTPGTQHIFYSKAADPFAISEWTANAVELTSPPAANYDFEPSIFIDQSGQLFIAYNKWNSTGDPNRASMEIMLANSTLSDDTSWSFQQITGNGVRDEYPGIIQDSSGLYCLFYAHDNGSGLRLVDQCRDLPGDARDIVIWDAVPPDTTLVPGSITGGGNESGGVITWALGDYGAGRSGTVSFSVYVDPLPDGTVIDNTAYMNYSNSNGSVVETLDSTSSTTIINLTSAEEPGEEQPGLRISLDSSCDGNIVTVKSDGSPVSGVDVEVNGDSIGTTDSGGEAEFSGCGYSVTIRASRSGYNPDEAAEDLIMCERCAVCEADSDCFYDEACVENECRMLECGCGQIIDHQCVEYQCCSDSDCPAGQACDGNSCKPPPECAGDEDCPDYKVCESGACVPKYRCESDEDCPDSDYCDLQDGFCRPVRDCGMAMAHKLIPYECGPEPDCPRCPAGKVCEDHICISEISETVAPVGPVSEAEGALAPRFELPLPLCIAAPAILLLLALLYFVRSRITVYHEPGALSPRMAALSPQLLDDIDVRPGDEVLLTLGAKSSRVVVAQVPLPLAQKSSYARASGKFMAGGEKVLKDLGIRLDSHRNTRGEGFESYCNVFGLRVSKAATRITGSGQR